MTKRKRFYIPCQWIWDKNKKCDKCGKLLTVNGSPTYWNPNDRARVRNICASCFETITEKSLRYGHA